MSFFKKLQAVRLWVQEHVEEMYYTYTIPNYELELVKDSSKDFEDALFKNAKIELCEALKVEKKEEMNSFRKTVTLKLRSLA